VYKRQEIQNTQLEVVEIEQGLIYSNESDDFIITGQPIVLNENNNIVKASKFSPEVLGISIIDVAVGEKCVYIVRGRLTLIDWSNIVEEDDELIPGATYYLSMFEPGKLTITAPNLIGDVVAQIGRAQNKEMLNIDIETPIYL